MLRTKMNAVISEVSDSLAERDELIHTIALALLTRKNLFVLGDPGQAKSQAIDRFRSHITDAKQFDVLMSKGIDQEQLFGRLDLASIIPGHISNSRLNNDEKYRQMRDKLKTLMESEENDSYYINLGEMCGIMSRYQASLALYNQGSPEILTEGKIPDSHICFLDELFKSNDGVLNSLLKALNERKYTNEGRTYPIPAISFFAASNEIPNFTDPQEQILAPLYDRLQIKVVTEDITDRDKRLSVLKSKQSGGDGSLNATISLSELYAMQQEVAAILVTDAINELADDVLCELRGNGIEVSDRKYLNYYPLVQAKAWLEGHDRVEPQDLLILKCYLWQAPGDRPTVENTLTRLCVNPLQDKVSSILAMAVEAQEDFNTVVADGGNPKAGSKALLKLRGELLQLYKRQQELCAAAQSESEKDMVNKLLNDLETISMTAHNAVNFTYIPLEQMAALQ